MDGREEVRFRSDVTVELVKHPASDADVLWAARVSTAGEQSLAEVEASTFPSFPQREIEMVAELMEAEWAGLMPLTHAAFERNGRVCP